MPTRLGLYHRPHKTTHKKHLYFDLQYSRKNRKHIHTSILLDEHFWDKNNRKIKRSHPNYKSLREAIKVYEQRIEVGEDRFLARQISFEQFASLVEGKSDISSVDRYIDTEIQRSRTVGTYKDYAWAFNTFKVHLGIKKPLKFEDITVRMLKDFKRLYIEAGRSNNSFNSVVDKIRAVYNDAKDNGVVYKELQFPRNYKLPKTPTEWTICTFDEFKNAIDRANTHRQWESLCMWLLSFCMRGMYFADFSSISENDIIGDNDEYQTWCTDKEFVIKHRRHKVKRRMSQPMFIRIDRYPTSQLFLMLKFSFASRYWNTANRDMVGDINDRLSIYSYNLNTAKGDKFHNEMMNSYQKAIRSVLPNQPMKNARKCFKTIANRNGTRRIADLLIGHSSDTQQNELSYNDNTYLAQEVYDTHTKVLQEFRADDLCELLQKKLISLVEKNEAPAMLADYSLEVIDKKGGIYLGKNETNQKGFESYFKSYNDLRFYEKDIPV
ncbi:MAG: phage integrase SAM-like domain-containing protein [Flavobacteriaceae bacterium]|nr:phage integrase SAM-like domain-containing protein [Flavobacteriaceae bacterium]